MRSDLPLWPNPIVWRVLHSHYADALAERRHGGGALPRDLAGFMAAVAAGDIGVKGVVTAEGLSYVVTRRAGDDITTAALPARAMDTTTADGSYRVGRTVTGTGRTVPLCRVAAKDLGLSRKVMTDETARVELHHAAANVPDDLSGWPL